MNNTNNMTDRIKVAQDNLEEAKLWFDNATTDAEVAVAIKKMDAAEEHLNYLFRIAKAEV